MPASFPSSVKEWIDKQDFIDDVFAGDINGAYHEIIAIENELMQIGYKRSVRVATTQNGDLATAFANGQTIDGVVLATGDRILIKDQANAAENGIYIVNASGAPTRAADANSSTHMVPGLMVYVREGAVNGKSTWKLTTTGAITLGTTPLTFENELRSHLADNTSFYINVKYPPWPGLSPAHSIEEPGYENFVSTEAIQAIIDYAYDHGIRRIYLPKGTYLANITLHPGMILEGAGRFNTEIRSYDPSKPTVSTNQNLYITIKDIDITAPYEQIEPLLDVRSSRYFVGKNIRVYQLPNEHNEYSYSAKAIDMSVAAPATWVGYNRLKNVTAVYCSYGLFTGGGLNSVLSIEDCTFSGNGYYNLYLDNVHVATIKNLDCAGGGQLRNSNIDKNLFGGIFIKGSNIIIDGVWYESNPPYIENSLLPNNCYIHPDSSYITINGERTTWTNTHNFYMLEDEIKGKNTRNIVPQDIGIGKGKPLNILPNSEFKYLGPSNIPLSWQPINSPIITPLFDNLPIGIETGINIQGEGGVRGIKFNLYPNIIKNLSNYIGQEIILTYYYRSNGGSQGNGRIGFKLTSNSYLSAGDLFHDYFNTNNKWIKVIQRHKITGNEPIIQIEIDCRAAGTSLDITQVICALDDHVIDTNGAVITEHGGNILSQDFKIGGKRHGYGTTPPVDGEWEKGDIIYNTNPSPGGFAGWICVTAGTPGTWKGFGLIES